MKPKTDAELLKEYLTPNERNYYDCLIDTNPYITMHDGEVISDIIDRLTCELHEAKEESEMLQSALTEARNDLKSEGLLAEAEYCEEALNKIK